MKVDHQPENNSNWADYLTPIALRSESIRPLQEVLIGSFNGIDVLRYKPSKPQDLTKEVSVIKVTNLNAKALEIDLSKGFSSEVIKVTKAVENHLILPDDVIVSTRFTKFLAARGGLTEGNILPYHNLAILRPNTDLILSEYLVCWLRDKKTISAIDEISVTVDSMKNCKTVGIKALRTLPIPIPSMEEQLEIVDLWKSIRDWEVQAQAELETRQERLNNAFLELNPIRIY
jgi:restriction endonuclease S subunit